LIRDSEVLDRVCPERYDSIHAIIWTPLKDVDAWDTLDRVVIENCDSPEYNTALEAITKERLRFTHRQLGRN